MIADKLQTLINTKAAIKAAIESKGVDVPASTQFSAYANLIAGIDTGVAGLECASGTFTVNNAITAQIIFDKPLSATPRYIWLMRIGGARELDHIYDIISIIGASSATGGLSKYTEDNETYFTYQTVLYTGLSYGYGYNEPIDWTQADGSYGNLNTASASGFSIEGTEYTNYNITFHGTYLYIAIV